MKPLQVCARCRPSRLAFSSPSSSPSWRRLSRRRHRLRGPGRRAVQPLCGGDGRRLRQPHPGAHVHRRSTRRPTCRRSRRCSRRSTCCCCSRTSRTRIRPRSATRSRRSPTPAARSSSARSTTRTAATAPASNIPHGWGALEGIDPNTQRRHRHAVRAANRSTSRRCVRHPLTRGRHVAHQRQVRRRQPGQGRHHGPRHGGRSRTRAA